MASSSTTAQAELISLLRYRAVESTPCNAAAFDDTAKYLVGSDEDRRPLTAAQNENADLTSPAAPQDTAGEPVHLCIEVSLPPAASEDDSLQGQTAGLEWKISTTSKATR